MYREFTIHVCVFGKVIRTTAMELVKRQSASVWGEDKLVPIHFPIILLFTLSSLPRVGHKDSKQMCLHSLVWIKNEHILKTSSIDIHLLENEVVFDVLPFVL